MALRMIGAAAALGMVGCATPTFSYIDGMRYFHTDMHSYSVIVLDVDGRSDTRNPVMVDPGIRAVRVQGPAAPGFSTGEARTLDLDVKPCTRYYLKAVKKSPLEQAFTPAVDYEEPISGCK